MPNTPTPSVIQTSYATGDPLQAREFVEEAYGARLRVGAIRESACRLTLDRLQAGELELAELDLPLDLVMRLPGRGQYVFSTVIDGTAEYRDEQDRSRVVPGDTYLGIGPDCDDLAHTRQLHVKTVSLPASVLDDIVARGRDQPPAWSFTSMRPVPGGARRWRHTVRSVKSLLTGIDADAAAPLITGPATRLLAATALAVFPNTAIAQPGTQDRHDAHPDTLRRATAFIESNPDLDMSLADIARAAYVTPRAVQLAFRRHLDITPMAYLRDVRLAHAHHQLQDAEPNDGLTISRIALDWGFANPSRFAAQYRAVYGQTPSQTLRSGLSPGQDADPASNSSSLTGRLKSDGDD